MSVYFSYECPFDMGGDWMNIMQQLIIAHCSFLENMSFLGDSCKIMWGAGSLVWGLRFGMIQDIQEFLRKINEKIGKW